MRCTLPDRVRYRVVTFGLMGDTHLVWVIAYVRVSFCVTSSSLLLPILCDSVTKDASLRLLGELFHPRFSDRWVIRGWKRVYLREENACLRIYEKETV